MKWYGTANIHDEATYNTKPVIFRDSDGKYYTLLFNPEVHVDNYWLNGITQLTVVGQSAPEWSGDTIIQVDTIHPTTRND